MKQFRLSIKFRVARMTVHFCKVVLNLMRPQRSQEPFSAVCLTAIPFEYRPRAFTIGFYENKNYQTRAYDLWMQYKRLLC